MPQSMKMSGKLQIWGLVELCGEPRNENETVCSHRIALTQRLILRWFRAEGRKFPWRKPTASKYQQVVAEVLLQRTRAEAVSNLYLGFIRCFPSWIKLALATERDLQEFLRPLGLWRRRAASLQLLAQQMAGRRGRFPNGREQIEKLSGVGQYICNAILMFDKGENQPLLDVNFARVLERVFGPRKLSDIRYDPYLQKLAWRVVQHRSPQQLNWAFLDLAAAVCSIRKPRCPICPLKNVCCHAQSGGVETSVAPGLTKITIANSTRTNSLASNIREANSVGV